MDYILSFNSRGVMVPYISCTALPSVITPPVPSQHARRPPPTLTYTLRHDFLMEIALFLSVSSFL